MTTKYALTEVVDSENFSIIVLVDLCAVFQIDEIHDEIGVIAGNHGGTAKWCSNTEFDTKFSNTTDAFNFVIALSKYLKLYYKDSFYKNGVKNSIWSMVDARTAPGAANRVIFSGNFLMELN